MAVFFVMHSDYPHEDAEKMVYAVISAQSITKAAQKVVDDEVDWQRLIITEHIQMLSDSTVEFEVYEVTDAEP